MTTSREASQWKAKPPPCSSFDITECFPSFLRRADDGAIATRLETRWPDAPFWARRQRPELAERPG